MTNPKSKIQTSKAPAGSTKERILDAAVALFNEQGADNVTTNHIAALADISPGNLYYHFKNKEEIVRALVAERLQPAVEQIWQFSVERTLTLADFQAMLHSHFELFWQFRFMRDFLALMRNDPLFAEGYRRIYQLRMKQFEELAQRFVQTGILRPTTDPTLYRKIVEICWIITAYWLAHLTATGISATPEAMQQGADLVMLTLQPYLSNSRYAA